ncbi:TIGR03826 family flagellar region protein [Ornithinibacillus halophilus]|uniref:Flagellar operon protein TIGR03826 n=1 Tax=Ornithinibacillus halophilus TaxID=930117 RepID=A0A1M5FE11_9BACI|nr:TIGR03826 family flagellar region protein [Ornithinibacillus halophilus]SHF89321.1 flagellar operon protein TIGR03826 [Ornithinibacillus halophilus]
MTELANCSKCGAVYVKTIRDICHNCYKEEEEAFQKVYQFLRQQKNRESTLLEVVEATGVEEELVIKFIKQKRLLTSQFPKLAYHCEKCDTPIISGKLCSNCSKKLKEELERFEKIEEVSRNREMEEKRKNTYYTLDKHHKNI